MPATPPSSRTTGSPPRPRGSSAIRVFKVIRRMARGGRKDDGLPPIERLHRKIGREQKRRTAYLVGSVLSVPIGVALWAYYTNPADRGGIFVYGVISLVAAMAIASLGAAQDKRWLVKRLEENHREMVLEEELAKTDGNSTERRAEKLLSINQHQLRRYYEQNLSQGSWIFLVGVVCLAGGLAIVGTTLWLLVRDGTPAGQDRWVVAAVGAIGSVLTNYVAAVYLKMHAASTASLAGFHEKLVATHELFFANVLASRTSAEKRDEITGQIALAIVRGTRGGGAQDGGNAGPGS